MEMVNTQTSSLRTRATTLVATQPDEALVYAMLDVAEAIREQTAAASQSAE